MKFSRRSRPHINHEFDLDLAPLLSVMVKLVPVLLISSAFVQISIVETDLPQAVKEALQQPIDNNKPQSLEVKMNVNNGFEVTLQKDGQTKSFSVPRINDQWDYKALHETLVQMKKEIPQIFRLDLKPEGDIKYQDIVKVMDQARRAQQKNVEFEFKDKEGKSKTTEFMFPDVVFANIMEG
jgi:biopolymer transport protein ExbD